MKRRDVLQICDVADEAGKIRPMFPHTAGSDWAPDGVFAVLRADGSKVVDITYRNGVPHGPFFEFWSNGGLAGEGQFSEGQQEGTWNFYKQDGTIDSVVEFKAGKQIRAKGKFGWYPQ